MGEVFFPSSKFPTREDALAEFTEIEKTTITKFNYNHANLYKAYEYEGDLFYEVKYVGLKTDLEIKENGIDL
ncbi:MAG: hypothetical protein RSC23_04390 [Carnobacterium sp.]|uniref:hypothetical protein n=1 Tax=Carnobacterium sp. TaxID=48221 RepID=UPI002FC97810